MGRKVVNLLFSYFEGSNEGKRREGKRRQGSRNERLYGKMCGKTISRRGYVKFP